VTVEQTNVIDIVSLNKPAEAVVLTISDHLDWTNTIEHQTILQSKFNAYLAFVESGEILERYPMAKGRRIVFKVVFKFDPDLEGRKFMIRAREVIQSVGFDLQYELFTATDKN
jgi:hypothetical protein